MTETITVNGTDRSSVIERKNVEWAESAYNGEIGTGRFVINDDAGTITVPGHKFFSVVQSASSPTHIARGYTHRKSIRRGETYQVGASREYEVATQDGNVLLSRLAITGTDSKRPQETVGGRVTWLLASAYLSTLVADLGAVTYPSTISMDATDYQGQFPGDVLAACAKAMRFNYYVRWNVAGAAWELVFRDDNASTADTCSVTITNDGTANSTSSFAPMQDADLTQDPEHVYSDDFYTYAKGTGLATLPATATAFAQRTGITEDSGTTNPATAARDAQTFLWESHLEEQLLPVTLRMRAAYVGLVQAGQRISTKMTHMAPEGWDPAQYARILRKRVTQPLNTDNDYDVHLDLAPQEAGPSVGQIVQSVFGRSDNFGINLTFPNPVTPGNHLIFAISSRGGPGYPASPGDAWGATAWTRFNGTQTTRNSAVSQDGCAMYWKVANVADQTGFIGVQSAVMGAWEISGCDPTSASVQYVNEGTGGTTYPIASLGAVASGALAFVVWCIGEEPGGGWPWGGPGAAPSGGYAWDAPNLSPGLSTGLVQDISQWAYDHYSEGYYIPAHPWSTICHVVGSGATITPVLTPGQAGHGYGAVAVKIPHA